MYLYHTSYQPLQHYSTLSLTNTTTIITNVTQHQLSFAPSITNTTQCWPHHTSQPGNQQAITTSNTTTLHQAPLTPPPPPDLQYRHEICLTWPLPCRFFPMSWRQTGLSVIITSGAGLGSGSQPPAPSCLNSAASDVTSVVCMLISLRALSLLYVG